MVMQMQPLDFTSELKRITGMGNYNVTPKLPTPVATNNSANSVNVKLPGSGYSVSPSPQSAGENWNSSTTLGKLMAAIRMQESHNNYRITNGDSGAAGAYQILPTHLRGSNEWARQVLHRDVSLQEFLNSPQMQDQIARYKLGEYLRKYGAAGAAVAWYGGEGAVNHMYDKKPQNGYPSLYDYWNSVLSKM